MKTPATQTAADAYSYVETAARAASRIETYARTNSDGRRELVFYTPGETHEWLNAAPSNTVDLEEWR